MFGLQGDNVGAADPIEVWQSHFVQIWSKLAVENMLICEPKLLTSNTCGGNLLFPNEYPCFTFNVLEADISV